MLLLAAVLASASAGETPATFSHEDFGFTVSRLSETTYVFRDPKMSRHLEVTYGAPGVVEKFEEKDPEGKVLRRQTFAPGRLTDETFAPEHRLVLQAPGPGSSLEITTTLWKDGVAQTSRKQIQGGKLASCDIPRSSVLDHSVEALAKDIKKLSFTLDPEQRVNADGCDNYPGGTAGLAKDLTAAMKKGLSCLLGQKREERRMDVAKLIALLNPPDLKAKAPFGKVRILCRNTKDEVMLAGMKAPISMRPNHAGLALDCSSGVWPPAIVLNLSNPKEEIERQDTLFHESLHLIGYSHFEGKDVPYLSAACCFKDPTDRQVCNHLPQEKQSKSLYCKAGKASEKACSLLGQPDSPWGLKQIEALSEVLQAKPRGELDLDFLTYDLEQKAELCQATLDMGEQRLNSSLGILSQTTCDFRPYWKPIFSVTNRKLDADRAAAGVYYGTLIRAFNSYARIDSDLTPLHETLRRGREADEVVTHLAELSALAISKNLPALSQKIYEFQKYLPERSCDGLGYVGIFAIQDLAARAQNLIDKAYEASPEQNPINNGNIKAPKMACGMYR